MLDVRLEDEHVLRIVSRGRHGVLAELRRRDSGAAPGAELADVLCVMGATRGGTHLEHTAHVVLRPDVSFDPAISLAGLRLDPAADAHDAIVAAALTGLHLRRGALADAPPSARGAASAPEGAPESASGRSGSANGAPCPGRAARATLGLDLSLALQDWLARETGDGLAPSLRIHAAGSGEVVARLDAPGRVD